jgi:glutaredoxin domain-containing cysteine-rich protein 1
MVDLGTIEADLRRMQLEIDRVLRLQADLTLIQRHGSVRGREFHVYNTLRRFQLRNQWKKDYIAEEDARVVIYCTSCGVVRETFERCRLALELLKSIGVRAEVRDLHISGQALSELLDRLGLGEEERNFVNNALPLIYVNGHYFGNHNTLIELNDKAQLQNILAEFQGRQKCTTCGDSGYTLCHACPGGKKSAKTFFNTNLRCAFCDENGIVPCRKCLL